MGPIAIVESRWWKTGNHSIKNLFEAVAAVHYSNPFAFGYDMFTDRSSLASVIDARSKDNTTEVIYLATHGDKNKIGQNAAKAVSRAELRNLIIAANTQSTIKGIYLGTCLTGNADTARFLLVEPTTNLVWVAGYRESVDWIDASAMDMVFMSKLAELYVANKKLKKGKLSPRRMAHQAASHLVKLISGAHAANGFNVYFKENNQLTSMFS